MNGRYASYWNAFLSLIYALLAIIGKRVQMRCERESPLMNVKPFVLSLSCSLFPYEQSSSSSVANYTNCYCVFLQLNVRHEFKKRKWPWEWPWNETVFEDVDELSTSGRIKVIQVRCSVGEALEMNQNSLALCANNDRYRKNSYNTKTAKRNCLLLINKRTTHSHICILFFILLRQEVKPAQNHAHLEAIFVFCSQVITVRNEVAKVMFLHLYVCPQGGVCLSVCWDTTPLGAGTPPPREQNRP